MVSDLHQGKERYGALRRPECGDFGGVVVRALLLAGACHCPRLRFVDAGDESPTVAILDSARWDGLHGRVSHRELFDDVPSHSSRV